jgi:hypothetical protein
MTVAMRAKYDKGSQWQNKSGLFQAIIYDLV